MSMTFWAHTQVGGNVSTDHKDRFYIYTFLDQLDALCRMQQLTEISELCDYSDSLSAIDEEMDEFDNFDGNYVEDTDDSGEVTWMAAHDARDLLIYLLNALENDPAALDIEEEEYEGLCDEISGCLDLVDAALGHDADALFNLSLIM